MASNPYVVSLLPMNTPKIEGLQADTCGQIRRVLTTAQTWLGKAQAVAFLSQSPSASESEDLLRFLAAAESCLERAYGLACQNVELTEPWAVAVADSLHHCQEALEKLAQDHAEL